MMVRRFCFGLSLVLSLAAVCNAVTDPNMITAADKISSVAEEDLEIVTEMAVGLETHVDRTYVFEDVGVLGGLNYVKTAVDDKTNATMEYSVTVDKAGTLLLLIDNRVGDGEYKDPPTLGDNMMAWVGDQGYSLTPYTVSNGADGVFSAYAKPVTAGTYPTYQQFDGSGRMTYLISAIPDGYNIAPLISGVAATASVAPGETLDIDATVSDLFGTNTSTTVAWTKVDGPSATFSPSATSEDVTVSFPGGEGVYTLRLTATDGNNAVTTAEIVVTIEIPKFALEATDWCQASNDSNSGPDAHIKSSRHYARNHSAPRRRIEFIKYDISSLKEEGKVFANSFITMNRDKGSLNEVLSIYAVKDGLDDFDISVGTWNNLPGLVNTPAPDPALPITIETMDLSELSPLLMEMTDVPNDEWYSSATSAAMDEYLNSDTNGIIVLVLVTFSPEDADFEIRSASSGAVDEETGVEGIALRGNVLTATWATKPNPGVNATISAENVVLSWTNPAGTTSTDVYIGIGDPNEDIANDSHFSLLADDDKTDAMVTVGDGIVEGGNTYTWVVNTTDGSGVVTRGKEWSFNAVSNAAPTVEIPESLRYVWLGNTGDPAFAYVEIDATVEDDMGTPTILWEQTEGPLTTISPSSDVEDIALTLNDTETYSFKLTATDSEGKSAFATIQIIVSADACEAAKLIPGYAASIADFDGNCVVDLADFAEFAAEWLDCNSLLCD